MKCPFPGMDPFLEGRNKFPGFHDRLAVYLADALQSQLQPPYFADVNERRWIELSDRAVEPDVTVALSSSHAARRITETAIRYKAEAVDPPLPPRAIVVPLPWEEHRETFIEIFTGRGQDSRLVTGIEILSPSNKRAGSRGRELYLKKQSELLERGVNLVEIDLLRGGEHTTAVPLWAIRERVGPFDYHVCVRYAETPLDPVVYPAKLQETLPEIAVPLLPADGAVLIDLQALFERVYDTGPYQVSVDYSGEVPPPSLSPADVVWVKERIAEAQTKTR